MLIPNVNQIKNTAKKIGKSKEKQQLEISLEKNNFLLTTSPNNLSEIKEKQNNSLTTKEKPQAELLAQIQV